VKCKEVSQQKKSAHIQTSYALLHVGLSLPKETPTFTVLGNHESIHELLVEAVGDLRAVLKENLLNLDLAGGRLLTSPLRSR
jgi:hypothetical protein